MYTCIQLPIAIQVQFSVNLVELRFAIGSRDLVTVASPPGNPAGDDECVIPILMKHVHPSSFMYVFLCLFPTCLPGMDAAA
eukprot:COSAG02_NODE_18344_length_944_cov_10.173538_1_plen_81_part_00